MFLDISTHAVGRARDAGSPVSVVLDDGAATDSGSGPQVEHQLADFGLTLWAQRNSSEGFEVGLDFVLGFDHQRGLSLFHHISFQSTNREGVSHNYLIINGLAGQPRQPSGQPYPLTNVVNERQKLSLFPKSVGPPCRPTPRRDPPGGSRSWVPSSAFETCGRTPWKRRKMSKSLGFLRGSTECF